MRIFAHLSNSANMLKLYETDASVHKATMEALWPQATRYNLDGSDSSQYLTSKTFNFAMIYFATPDSLAKRTGLTLKACTEFRLYWLDYYGVEDWMNWAGTMPRV